MQEPRGVTRWCVHCKHEGEDESLCETCMEAGDNREKPCWEEKDEN